MDNQKRKLQFACPKCQSTDFEIREHQGENDTLGNIFGNTTRFVTLVVCNRCRYCDVYDFRENHFREVYDID